jgi:hypothetical protein
VVNCRSHTTIRQSTMTRRAPRPREMNNVSHSTISRP